jgi:Sec-independent protein translocase protein TatA
VVCHTVGVSLTEFTVIFLVALVLFGPEQLPVLARTLGKLTGQLKRTSDSLRREFYNSVYPPGQEARDALNEEIKHLRNLKAEVLAPPTGAVGTSSRPQSTEQQPVSSEQPQQLSQHAGGTIDGSRVETK